MVALLLIFRDCGVAAKNTLFKHFLRSGRPKLSSACTKNQLSNVPSEIFNLKRNQQRNLHEQICNFREQVVRAGCKLLRANCQSKYQHCGGSLQSCAEKNIRFDCNPHTYMQTHTLTVVQGQGGGGEWAGFVMLQYFKKFLPLVDSL